MRVVLKQVFPLGRFHATPWRVNPFDDPLGEWPPSPWRLVRAVVARWYQWARESLEERSIVELDNLVKALCTSRYAFRLPPAARRGSPLRQYFPAEFKMDPPNYKEWELRIASCREEVVESLRKVLGEDGTVERCGDGVIVRVKKKKTKKKVNELLATADRGWKGLNPDPGLRAYTPSLAQDNYWCTVPTDEGAVWWFLEGKHWNEALLEILDRCLERITYFGRTESFTRIRRVNGEAPEPNCSLSKDPQAGAVRVLVPSENATLEDIKRITDDPMNVERSIPVGARELYAVRPPSTPVREEPTRTPRSERARLIQFAIGWHVVPPLRATVFLTARFRDAVLREILREKTNGACSTWSRASREIREQIALLIGKDADGQPLHGHQHAEFLVWYEGGVPTRLLVWRESFLFDEKEEGAILAAASRGLSWSATGSDTDAWKVKLLPLDRSSPCPPGFNSELAQVWESVTPYVPPWHYVRRGKIRDGMSIADQVRREAELRSFARAAEVKVEEIRNGQWVAVYIPPNKRSSRAFLGDRRGYWLRLSFPEPVRGPIRLGRSSSLGLGLFKPVQDPHRVR